MKVADLPPAIAEILVGAYDPCDDLERAIGVISFAVDLPIAEEMPLPTGGSKIAHIGVAGNTVRPGLGDIRGLDCRRGSNACIWIHHMASSLRALHAAPKAFRERRFAMAAEQDATVHIGAKIPFSLPSACTMREKKSGPQVSRHLCDYEHKIGQEGLPMASNCKTVTQFRCG